MAIDPAPLKAPRSSGSCSPKADACSAALTDVNGDQVESMVLAGMPALVMFLCNHCPNVRHIEARLRRGAIEFADVPTVGICSNDANGYPDEAPERLGEQARRAGWRFPNLVDTSQEVVRSFGAACIPTSCCTTRMADWSTAARLTPRRRATVSR